MLILVSCCPWIIFTTFTVFPSVVHTTDKPAFNPAGCDYIGSGKMYSYAIYSSVFVQYETAKERCAANHKNGRLAWMAEHEDMEKLEYILLYTGYINGNIDYWIDGLLNDSANGCSDGLCTWVADHIGDHLQTHLPMKAQYTFQTAYDENVDQSYLAPVLSLVAHRVGQDRVERKAVNQFEYHGFICSFPVQFTPQCPDGFSPVPNFSERLE
ncbi:uncharacterized protein DEA37_0012873 [Paragonimus westermani]|uniref:C-type lectin domain-containing protein n=1 Tax=Paragonimus westermani TaxID=34504 RepID=A0A5J4NS65_9TREM|nr:uncharacterized protein DEA37_0012873 [Paragonimus westermani]